MLKELRIEGAQREELRSGLPAWAWITAGVLLVLALLAGGGWWWWRSAQVPEVQTAAVQARSGATGNAVLQATGYVTARRAATVSTQITGTLTEVLFEEGDRVQKGQVLARLEDHALRAALDMARASVKSAQANIEAVRAQWLQAQADLRRQDELAASGMTTRQSAEQARTAVNSYAAQLEARRREAEASMAQAAQAQVNFDYTVVRAPFSGVITAKAAQVGEIVSPLSAGGGFTRTGVGTIVDMDSLEVDVDVNEAYIGQVKADMPAEAVLDAYPDWRIPSHVIAVVPAADRGKATVKVRVALEQKDQRLVPDMGVRVSFLAGRAEAPTVPPPGVLVPRAAVVTRSEAPAAFVVTGTRAELRRLRTGTPVGDQAVVLEGLKAGETVVLNPPDTLNSGDALHVVPAAR
ncbi:efflux RND transporter periplasmic adaptor subunit [Roseateles sp. SL47]|uniref:efflux RND transporter periplasmic adaptor subunit n=1 Tax=Roseateles sp. SL47 TaxID=2995138 RepID=UPI002270D0C7|nr:efflux RND transporter periplasmic adaptor subunit [Roseateles sp. SL47]WAC72565.1 efflux RND transporter periplasmic adaptor subunit [Roseateles sp. SL47]